MLCFSNFFIESPNIRKVTFEAGSLGIRVDDWETGVIIDVLKDSQAAQKGVLKTWRVYDIAGEGLSRDILISKARGKSPYDVIFATGETRVIIIIFSFCFQAASLIFK